MSKPRLADNKPIAVHLRKGEEYDWCACGRSKTQPFCDGSHQGTDITPVRFQAEADGEAWLCLCKHTGTPPYCNGTHTKFSADRELQPSPEEPTLRRIHDLSRDGLAQSGRHGEMTAMGVPRNALPSWDDIQVLTAQLASRPLMEDASVGSELVVGPKADKPLVLDMPLLVADMSFGAISEEAKIALARGAELAYTGICSGEGGMLPEEQQNNSRYLYELGPAMFGYREEILTRVQAFHFKGGQAAKTGSGGQLPGAKVTEQIARIRGLQAGQDAISPAAFSKLVSSDDFHRFADRVRELSGGIPVGFKMSANHIEADIDFALAASADYLILDGRGGGTGAAPRLFRDHISVPTIPALARARHHLEERGRNDVTLIITGGLRTPEDFIKALAMGADGIALATGALQAIGCIAARVCHTNNCPSGIATQRPELRQRVDIDDAPQRLARFLTASLELMKVMARACGHSRLNQFNPHDLSTWNRQMSELAHIHFAGDSE